VEIATSVTLVAGLFQLAMRICQLGVICSFMSMPFIIAFLTASATQIVIAQVIDLWDTFSFSLQGGLKA